MWAAPNTSGGFHEFLKDRWEGLAPDAEDVLLVGEGRAVKAHMQATYPEWRITTADLFLKGDDSADLAIDICSVGTLPVESFDLIINQANLEHVYDPFGAMRNLSQSLRVGGVHVLHTHLPGMDYHAFPRDYFRFMPDWFLDLPERLDRKIGVLGVWPEYNIHVFAAYNRVSL